MKRTFGKAARSSAAVFVVAGFLVAVAAPLAAHAQVDLGLNYATSLGLTTTDIRITIGRIISAFLGFLGLVAVVIMLYAGFTWMTSGGSADKIDRAKKMMLQAVIGLVIILSAFAIVQFIIRAITGTFPVNLGGGTTGSQAQSLAAYRSGNTSALGNGIIEYHYPESGQTGVARNTNISITFKRDLVLSTVFKNYDDKGTFDTSDDTITTPSGPVSVADYLKTNSLELNTDNVKIIPNEALKAPGTGTADQQFDTRYASAITDPAPFARVTQVAQPFDPTEEQTAVISPQVPLGSATNDITYRVALRGGDNGIKVWVPDPTTGKATATDAFSSMTVDGAYYWPFATGTSLDVTPPQISAVVPQVAANPSTDLIDRNQLLQIYFDEAVDPTTASGILGSGGGFNDIEVQARCLPGVTCTWGGGDTTTFSTIPGAITIGNKYRTAEFKPSQPCDGVTQNSCGETVYCLPKNVEVRVRAKAATLSSQPPKAQLADGVLDMAGNSLDGNHNGTAEGPQSVDRPNDYDLNQPQSDLTKVDDTAKWTFDVGDHIDLVPPKIMNIDPQSAEPSTYYDQTAPLYSTAHGSSKVPTDVPITILWSKVMSIDSMRTGAFDETTGKWKDDRSTVALRAYECEKTDPKTACTAGGSCPCDPLDPPSFFIDAGTGPITVNGTQVTQMKVQHRIFFTANDLGYTESDITNFPNRIPSYQPVLRAQIMDDKQNCFYPSQGYECTGSSSSDPSCCDKNVQTGGYNCPLP